MLVIASLTLVATLEAWVGNALPLRPSVIEGAVERTGPAAPVVFVLVVIAAVVVPPLPSVPLDVAAGGVFGFWWGSALTLTGDVLGGSIAFLLARRFGRRWTTSRATRSGEPGVIALAEGLTPRALAVVRLIPTFSFELVSYAAGLSSMSLGAFMVATLAGVALPVMALVAIGDALVEHERLALTAGSVLLGATVVPLLWWSFRGRRDTS